MTPELWRKVEEAAECRGIAYAEVMSEAVTLYFSVVERSGFPAKTSGKPTAAIREEEVSLLP